MSYNSYTPLNRTDTSSSVSTNATAPNRPGPGRLVGRVFDGLGKRIEFLLNNRATHLGKGPIPVAQEIRSLRQHDVLTVQERYSKSSIPLSKREMKRLKKLCDALVKFSGSRVLSTQLNALEEMTALAVDDEVIRSMFAKCRLEYLTPKYTEPELLLSSTKALNSIHEAATHELWSTTILRSATNPDWSAIENSFRNPDSSFIAARHLSNLLQLEKSEIGYALFSIFLRVGRESRWDIEWSNLSNCISHISASSEERFLFDSFNNAFSGSNEADQEFVSSMVRECATVPGFFSVFFAVPEVDYVEGSDITDFEKSFAGVSNWKLDKCATFCVMFLKSLSGSEEIDVQLLFLQRLSPTTRHLLRNTALMEDICIAYCHLIHFSRRISSNCASLSNWRRLMSAATILVRYIDDSDISQPRRSLATFLAVRFGSLDRYCKMAIQFASGSNSTSFSFSMGVAKKTRKVFEYPGEYSLKRYIYFSGWPTFIELRRRSFFLIRLTVDGVCHYVSSTCLLRSPFEVVQKDLMNVENVFRRHLNGKICVDILPYGEEEIMDLHVGDNACFNANGHFPILVGHNDSGHALYYVQAISDSQSYSTSIIDGSSTATFMNKYGKMRNARNFKVAVLRFDPNDWIAHEQHENGNEGAMDPTGPLHWRRIWPVLDTGLYSFILAKLYHTFQMTMSQFFHKCALVAATQGSNLEGFLS